MRAVSLPTVGAGCFPLDLWDEPFALIWHPDGRRLACVTRDRGEAGGWWYRLVGYQLSTEPLSAAEVPVGRWAVEAFAAALSRGDETSVDLAHRVVVDLCLDGWDDDRDKLWVGPCSYRADVPEAVEFDQGRGSRWTLLELGREHVICKNLNGQRSLIPDVYVLPQWSDDALCLWIKGPQLATVSAVSAEALSAEGAMWLWLGPSPIGSIDMPRPKERLIALCVTEGGPAAYEWATAPDGDSIALADAGGVQFLTRTVVPGPYSGPEVRYIVVVPWEELGLKGAPGVGATVGFALTIGLATGGGGHRLSWFRDLLTSSDRSDVGQLLLLKSAWVRTP